MAALARSRYSPRNASQNQPPPAGPPDPDAGAQAQPGIPPFNPPQMPGYTTPPSTAGFNYQSLPGDQQGKMIANDRDLFYGRGEQLNANLGGRSQQQGGLAEGYRGNADQIAAFLAQNPGYTPQEAQQILRQQDLQNLNNIDYQSNFLNPDEQTQVGGNPYQFMAGYDPGSIYEALGNGAKWTRDAQQATAGDLRNNVAQTRGDLGAAIDPYKLGLSGEYRGNQDAALNKTSADVYDPINYGKLTVSDAYSNGMQFGPEDTQRLATQAGIGVGQRFSAIQDANERQMAAAGNSNPLALAAMRNRSLVDSAAAGSDAALAAQIQGKGLELGTQQQRENTRLGAEQTYAGMRSGAAQNLGNMALNAVGQREGLRLGSEQDISNRQGQAALAGGQLANNALQYSGNQQLTNEQMQQARNVDTQTAQQKTGMDALKYAEAAQQEERNAAIAANRQGVNAANQQNQFNRGFQVNDTLSKRNTDVANARAQGTRDVLGYNTGQQQMANTNVNTANQQQIANYGAQSGATQGATAQGIQNKGVNSANSWGNVAKGVVGNLAGNVFNAGSKKYIGG